MRSPALASRGTAIAGAAIAICATAIGALSIVQFATATREDTSGRNEFSHSLSGFADLGRLARCSWIVSDDVGASPEEALLRLKASDQTEVEARLCQWHSVADEHIERSIKWRRTGASTVELCGEIRRNASGEPGKAVDRDSYTFPEIDDAPAQEGSRCYNLDVSETPLDKWGVPPSTP